MSMSNNSAFSNGDVSEQILETFCGDVVSDGELSQTGEVRETTDTASAMLAKIFDFAGDYYNNAESEQGKLFGKFAAYFGQMMAGQDINDDPEFLAVKQQMRAALGINEQTQFDTDVDISGLMTDMMQNTDKPVDVFAKHGLQNIGAQITELSMTPSTNPECVDTINSVTAALQQRRIDAIVANMRGESDGNSAKFILSDDAICNRAMFNRKRIEAPTNDVCECVQMSNCDTHVECIDLDVLPDIESCDYTSQEVLQSAPQQNTDSSLSLPLEFDMSS